MTNDTLMSELKDMICEFIYDKGIYNLNFNFSGYHICDYDEEDTYCYIESELKVNEYD